MVSEILGRQVLDGKGGLQFGLHIFVHDIEGHEKGDTLRKGMVSHYIPYYKLFTIIDKDAIILIDYSIRNDGFEKAADSSS
ncbi:unnamed protein product [Victoria cruziana]